MAGAEVRYVYDGRRVIQERNSGNTPTVTYTRGPDLSGSFEGAGGIGGLLARSNGYSSGSWTTHNFYHADGGGNITSMVNNHASAAAVVASYQYDPFGRTLSQSGTMAAANVYRFSSKEIHVQSGMYGYGFRFYDPTLQRLVFGPEKSALRSGEGNQRPAKLNHLRGLCIGHAGIILNNQSAFGKSPIGNAASYIKHAEDWAQRYLPNRTE